LEDKVPTVKVGDIVKLVGGQRSGNKARVLKNLNAFAIKAVIVGGKHDGEILGSVRFPDYEKA
jgi:ribosomal protein L24